jgi:hypothetical protein
VDLNLGTVCTASYIAIHRYRCTCVRWPTDWAFELAYACSVPARNAKPAVQLERAGPTNYGTRATS